MFVGITWLLVALAWRGTGSEPLRPGDGVVADRPAMPSRS